MKPEDSPWTEPRIAMLRRLWPGDLSTAAIAKQLGGGITKNGVVGKAHRLGLPRRMDSMNPDHKPHPTRGRLGVWQNRRVAW